MRNALSYVLLLAALPCVAGTTDAATISKIPTAAKQIVALIITEPAAGAKYQPGVRVKLVWNAAAISEPWFFGYIFDVGAQKRWGSMQMQNTGSHEGWLPVAQDKFGKYYFVFESYGGKRLARSGTFELVPGVIPVTAPAAGQFLEIGKPFTIRWDGTPAGPPNTTVWLSVYSVALGKSGGGYPVSNSGSFEWTPTAYDKGRNKILISTGDDRFKGESGVFTIGLKFQLQPGEVIKKK